MSVIAYFLYTIYFRFIHILDIHRIVVVKNLFFKNVVNIDKTCQLFLIHGRLSKSKVFVKGKHNKCILKGNIQKTFIKIVGENNIVKIDKNVVLLGGEIVVRGNNCIVSICESTTIGHSIYIVCMGNHNSISIGRDCMIADNVDIWNTDSHPIFDERKKLINNSKPIVIGNHVWIGKCCKILKGSIIGHDTVVGMNSLVTRELDCESVYAGNPAVKIKKNVSWERSFISKYECD